MNSKMQSAPPFRLTAWRKRAPCSSMTTSSPGRSSRSSRAPIRSSAHVSDASTHASSRRPTTSGRIPSGSRKPASAPLREDDRGERALDVRHRVGHGVGQVVGRVLGDQGGDHLGVGCRLEADAPFAQVGAERRRVGQVAVVAERDRSVARMAHDRLGVLPHRRSRGGVAGVADRDVAGEARQARLVEHLVHEAHVLHRHHLRAVRDGDPGALLAAVLEGVEAEVGEPGDVAVVIAGRVVDAEDAAHQAGSSPSARGIAPS